LRVQYWNISIKQQIDSDKRIRQIIAKMNTESLKMIRDNTLSISRALAKALEDRRKLCKENNNNRKEYLEKVMNDLKERNNTGHISVKQLIQREDSRNDFRKIRNVIKPNKNSGIKFLDVASEEDLNVYNRIIDHKLIEELILKRNMTHFSQANNTPFERKKLTTTIRISRDQPTITAINKQQCDTLGN
jgi:hypothetical protein